MTKYVCRLVSPARHGDNQDDQILRIDFGWQFTGVSVRKKMNASHFRIFLSSTFSDMRQEREQLTKHVIPELRALCEEVGSSLSEIDLRWGITEKQVEQGHVLPICLEEVMRCNLFLGIVGFRYGWIPSELPGDILAQRPSLQSKRGRSVTELEIELGLLRFRKPTAGRFIYLRGHDCDDSRIARNIRVRRDDVLRLGKVEAEGKRDEARSRLKHLRKRLLRHDRCRVYETSEEFADLVREDYTCAIEGLLRELQMSDPSKKQTQAHVQFLSRKSKGMVGAQTRIAKIERSKRNLVAVVGSAGSGKSALVGSYLESRQARENYHQTFVHCAEATPESAKLSAILNRLVAVLRQKNKRIGPMPEDVGALRASLAHEIEMLPSKYRILVMLDGLDRMQPEARGLAWLPNDIPNNVTVIVTADVDRAEDLRQQGFKLVLSLIHISEPTRPY